MAIIDVVKYDSNDEEFVWKFPSDNLRLGTQLVVKQSQVAFFVKGGKVLDPFESGTYTLKSGNIPILHNLLNLPFGGDTPFQAEVWFVNLISKLDNKWGTPTPIQLEDPKYGVIIPVRAFGQFGFKISNPSLFLESLVGTIKVYNADKIIEYFIGKIISTITIAIGKKIILENVSVLQISVLLDDLSKYSESSIKDEFAKFGIDIVNFFIVSINIPESDPSVIKLKEIKEKAMYINTVGRDVYSFDKSMEVMDKAASNEGSVGGTMGAGMGLGMGLGVGSNMGNQMGNISSQMNSTLAQGQQNTPPPPPSFINIQYFVLIDNQQQGPFDSNQIQQLILQKKMNKDSFVWKQGMADWNKAESQPDLIKYFNQMPPPPPFNNV